MKIDTRFYSQDDSGGGGKNTDGDESSKTPDLPKIEFTPEQQKELQRQLDEIAGKVRKEEKTKGDKKLDDDRVQRETDEALRKGEVQKIYEQEKSAHDIAKKNLERLPILEAEINKTIDGEIKSWPAEVAKSDPGAQNVESRMQWVSSHRELAASLTNLGKSPQSEHGQGSSTATNAAQSYIDRTYRPKKP